MTFGGFQIEHTADDGPHIINVEKNHETARQVEFTLYGTGSVIGSERSSFLIDNYIYVLKMIENVNNMFVLIVRFQQVVK